ncbi:hypothetical protein Tsubulata_014230 [Turnera subulata]|uniref:Cytochrome P450 n=1 Tax=Turnera subulata TaxID=218843 RepID=A0A9Q0FMS8_9ROSI|nr:hypothetical protein Tsubulata_014230 [Turnera subulata]
MPINLPLIGLAFFLLAWLWARGRKNKRLPPGSSGLPIFGTLHLLGKFPHRDLQKLARKYGSIMYMRLGFFDYKPRSTQTPTPTALWIEPGTPWH